MPHLNGVDISNDKKLPYTLRYISDVGPCRADLIVEQTGLDPNMRAHNLMEKNINRIIAVIIENGGKIESDLRRKITSNLKRLQAIKCYRGIHHYHGIPVRVQRTSTNACTRKRTRKTIGVIRKK